MPWNTPRTAGVGDVYTSAWYNADTRDNLRYIKGLAGSVEIEDDLALTASLSVAGELDVGGSFTLNGVAPQYIPAGAVLELVGTTVPAGFLRCDGSAVSRTTYAALFVIVGLRFETFNVLYGADFDGEFWEIDVGTPANSILLGSFPSGLANAQGLASYGNAVYGVDSDGDELWEIDVVSPGNSSLVGSLPGGLGLPTGMAGFGGRLYALDTFGRELWEINVDTPGNSSLVGTFPSGLVLPTGLAGFGDTLYVVDSAGGIGELWEVDVVSPGNSSLVGTFPGGLTNPQALASSGDTLYAADNAGDELWEIDAVTPGNSVLVGSLPGGLTSPIGMAGGFRATGTFRLPTYSTNRDDAIVVIKT